MRLWVIMTCALILPLVVSIYRDSSAYGTRLYLLDVSHGAAFRVAGAKETDAGLFEGLPGLSGPRYEDGAIYLAILSDAEWRDGETVEYYAEKLRERMDGRGGMTLTAFDYDFAHGVSDDPAAQGTQAAALAVNIFLMALAAVAVRSAYRQHLARFEGDMRALFCCGAEMGQVRRMFLAEFAGLFALSAAAALAISAGAMGLLFRTYLEVRDVPGLAWVVFRMDPVNTAAQVAFFLIAMGAALASALRRRGKGEMRVRRRGLAVRRRPAATLAALWRQRANGTYRQCLAVSVPAMAVFLFIFGCLAVNLRDLEAGPEYGVRLTKTDVSSGGFTDADLESIRGAAGVAGVRPRGSWDVVYDLMPPDPSVRPVTVRLRPMEGLSGVQAAAGRDAAGFAEGDTLTLFPAFAGGRSLELTLTALADGEGEIYVSQELYSSIAAALPLDVADIELAAPGLHAQVSAELRGLFPGAGYEIEDLQAGAELARDMAAGVYALMAMLFAVLFIFVLVIICARLRDHIDDSRSVIRALFTVGAPPGVLRGSYMRQASRAALAASALPAAVCVPALGLAAAAEGKGLPTGGAWALAMACTAAGMAIAYLAPVWAEINKVLRKVRDGHEHS